MDFTIPEDLKMLQTLARDFVKDQLIRLERELLGREATLEGAKRRLSPEKEAELIQMAREMGLWGLGLPEELGGSGLGVLATCLVEEELAKTIIPFNLGDVTPILFDCSEEQKRDYLRPLVEGQKSAYLALFEPGQGLDPSTLQMKAVKANGSYILNGTKIVFSQNSKADFAIVFAVTDSSKRIHEGVTGFLVDSGTPGFSISELKPTLGWKAQVAEPVTLTFENCQVPAWQMLGEEGKAFQLGKKYLMSRRIVRGARSVGAAVRLLDTSVAHAKSWQSYGKMLETWPAIQILLADIATDIRAARLMVHQAACQADEGRNVSDEAAMVKVFTGEMLERVAGRVIQIKGGPGPAQELPLEVLCQSLLVSHIKQRGLQAQKAIIAADLLKLGKIL